MEGGGRRKRTGNRKHAREERTEGGSRRKEGTAVQVWMGTWAWKERTQGSGCGEETREGGVAHRPAI